MSQKIKNMYSKRIAAPITVFLVIIALLLITTPTFRSAQNALQIMLSASIYVVLAMGISFVLICGCSDLSAGSVVGLAGCMTCIAMRDWQFSLVGALLVGLATGALCGFFNGLMVTKMHLMPFIATLGTQWIYRGTVKLVADGATVSLRTFVDKETIDAFYFIGSGRIFEIPTPVFIWAALAAVLWFVLKKTVFGRYIYAVGSNAEAARMSGINISKITFGCYIITDMMAAIAGILLAGRLVSMQVNAGEGYEFEGIFATVIGGTSLAGGEGSILGALIGAFIVAILRNGLNLNGINAFWQQVILGIIIILTIWFDTYKSRRSREI
ncbi:MAG TPA: ABC transporter permease [Candidatus Pullichristensenella excrementigallinarum]|uniref:ABC transporter permease n=1 Tax=Candidatus Pullichristensenella excrementigallinarum TaxID=2840907 RepID=A0A9D1IAV4_9FIRM|nr:ABC transporter permease [Candidatus Pullichristensenella excrementigallinarum]